MRHRTLITHRARSLRKAMSEPEVMLWSRLRGRRPDRPTFRRQHPVGSIILDFYCPAARLAVEVDGSTHWDNDAQLRDAARDRWLESQGIVVLRLPAGWVYADLSAAVDAVLLRALERQDELSRRPLAPSTIGSSLRSADGPPPADAPHRGR
jgi:very-short-patch-repair endonuclease